MVQVVSNYTMSTFRIPLSMCYSLDRLAKNFWWGTRANGQSVLALKAWWKICQPKEFGGLGYKLFQEINTALLAKLGWKVTSAENSLWVQLLTAKYLQYSSFFSHTPPHGASLRGFNMEGDTNL